MLTDLADALRAGGVPVVEYPGWKTRRETDGPFAPRALVYHHDASPRGPSPSVQDYLANLTHPGAQLWVDYAGTWHTIAAGRMWHAGAGSGWGVVPAQQGNTYSVGVETDHTTGEQWPTAQLASIIKGFAVLCKHYGWNPTDAVLGHKEYAPGRKTDPDPMEMNWFRGQVSAAINHPLEDDVTPDQMNILLAAIKQAGLDRPLTDLIPDGTPVNAAGDQLRYARADSNNGWQTALRIEKAVAALTDQVSQLVKALAGKTP